MSIAPRKDLGQHFLVDENILRVIERLARLAPEDVVLEVGPGLGVLTWELLRHAGAVVAAELDFRLVDRLRQEFAGERRLAIVQGDILRLPPDALFEAAGPALAEALARYKVVANLPYAITSPALRHFLEAAHRPELMVVLVQWEVAQRIAAQPGDLSVLAHAIQIYAEPEVVARVPAGSFVPAPAVDSAVLRLRVRPRPAVAAGEAEALLRTIKAGFLHARKKLSNGLPGGLAAMGARVPKDQVGVALAAAGVDGDRRAETLTLAEWERVYRELARAQAEAEESDV